MIPLISLDELHTQFRATLQWLETMDLPLAPRRIALYRRVLSEAMASVDSLTPFERSNADYAVALLEVAELCRIAEGCQRLPQDDELRRRLDIVRTGAAHHVDEIAPSGKRKSAARDFAFELICASIFAKAGLRTRLPTNGDVRLRCGGRWMLAECKRIASFKKLHSELESAFDQINVRRTAGNDPRALGLACLDVSPFFNEGVSLWAVDDEDTLSTGVDTFIARMRAVLRGWFPTGSRGPLALGILLRLQLVVAVKDLGLVTTVHQMDLDTFLSHQNRDAQGAIGAMAAAFNRSMPDERLRFEVG